MTDTASTQPVSPPFEVTIVGPGRVGRVLAAALARGGHRIVGVAGGAAASRAAFRASHPTARDVTAAEDARPSRSTTLVAFCVPDDALVDVAREWAREIAAGTRTAPDLALHVAGSRGVGALSPLAERGVRIAVAHPAQTVPRRDLDPDHLLGASWGVSAATDADLDWVMRLVEDCGGDPQEVLDDQRATYHAALAVASNAGGAVVSTAAELLRVAGIERPAGFLMPLVAASVESAMLRGAAGLTGPVVRGDSGTLARHVEALAAPELADLRAAYVAAMEVVLALVADDLGPEVAADVRAVLGTATTTGATTGATNAGETDA